MEGWKLRCKTKTGQYVVQGVGPDTTLSSLKDSIASVSCIKPQDQKLMKGFPPQAVPEADSKASLLTLGLRNGDTITIADVEEQTTHLKSKSSSASIAAQLKNYSGALKRKVVPANNSCLFTSIHYVMEGGKLNLDAADGMRQLIASIVMSDPENYSEVFLGRANDAYCAWIMDGESWGGAIEVAIFADIYQMEIAVVDTQSVRVDKFGEDKQYGKRVFLIYDGIHYDPLELENGGVSQTIFSSGDNMMLAQALDVAAEAKEKRQYTDVTRFSLRCLACQEPLVGQTEAQEHAKKTGHIKFGEY